MAREEVVVKTHGGGGEGKGRGAGGGGGGGGGGGEMTWVRFEEGMAGELEGEDDAEPPTCEIFSPLPGLSVALTCAVSQACRGGKAHAHSGQAGNASG
jgi:hypothetical protein